MEDEDGEFTPRKTKPDHLTSSESESETDSANHSRLEMYSHRGKVVMSIVPKESPEQKKSK